MLLFKYQAFLNNPSCLTYGSHQSQPKYSNAYFSSYLFYIHVDCFGVRFLAISAIDGTRLQLAGAYSSC